MRLHFKVEGLKQDTSGKKFQKHPMQIFTAFVNSVKLKQPSPPNKLFTNDNQQPSDPRATLTEDDDGKDCKLIEDGANKGSNWGS